MRVVYFGILWTLIIAGIDLWILDELGLERWTAESIGHYIRMINDGYEGS